MLFAALCIGLALCQWIEGIHTSGVAAELARTLQVQQAEERSGNSTAQISASAKTALPDGQALSGEAPGTSEEGSSSAHSIDPLALEQEGFTFMQSNEKADIFWYRSQWGLAESRSLFERALALKGWRLVSSAEEQLMCFVSAPTAYAEGGTLSASFYALESGCSILVEVMS